VVTPSPPSLVAIRSAADPKVTARTPSAYLACAATGYRGAISKTFTTPMHLTDKHVELAGAGKPNGDRRPLGCHNDRITPCTVESFPCSHLHADRCNARPGEVAIVREVIDRVAAGETLTR